MDKHILLIVEGPRDEETLVRKLWDRFDKNVNYIIVPYRTNVHVLIKDLFRDGIDDDVDVVRYLKSSDIPEDRRIAKSMAFTDVYLIFDFDPQDPLFDGGMLAKVLRFFSDSTDHGKLFINYPMMQSYRHITGPHDDGFRDRAVPARIGKKYKSLVDAEAWKLLKQINTLDKEMLRFIIECHLKKMNRVVAGDYSPPSLEGYRSITQSSILDRQLERMDEDGMIFVLNTSLFLIVDYNPHWFLEGSGPQP